MLIMLFRQANPGTGMAGSRHRLPAAAASFHLRIPGYSGTIFYQLISGQDRLQMHKNAC
jgi:hypothetical protein